MTQLFTVVDQQKQPVPKAVLEHLEIRALDALFRHYPGGQDHDQSDHGNWADGAKEPEIVGGTEAQRKRARRIAAKLRKAFPFAQFQMNLVPYTDLLGNVSPPVDLDKVEAIVDQLNRKAALWPETASLVREITFDEIDHHPSMLEAMTAWEGSVQFSSTAAVSRAQREAGQFGGSASYLQFNAGWLNDTKGKRELDVGFDNGFFAVGPEAKEFAWQYVVDHEWAHLMEHSAQRSREWRDIVLPYYTQPHLKVSGYENAAVAATPSNLNEVFAEWVAFGIWGDPYSSPAGRRTPPSTDARARRWDIAVAVRDLVKRWSEQELEAMP